jgi:hypothetical protein
MYTQQYIAQTYYIIIRIYHDARSSECQIRRIMLYFYKISGTIYVCRDFVMSMSNCELEMTIPNDAIIF